ncbi:MAG TPA: RNA 2',3'-cyclic phosphodiesterase [Chloroflexota bacterium]|nr:RNA 2',3'-cyclic phosphodiesterase [Chloroflexota bacterium]
MSIRLFLAINLPDAVRRGLEAAVTSSRAANDDVRWARAESLHLTLVFLGERPAAQVEAISQAAGGACAGLVPFSLTVAEPGCFPSPARPRVLWVGIAEGRESLIALQRAVLGALARAGLADQVDRFSPHLTLGRVRDSVAPAARAALAQKWTALALPALPLAPVRAIYLMRSELGPGGARYSVLRTLPLNGALIR